MVFKPPALRGYLTKFKFIVPMAVIVIGLLVFIGIKTHDSSTTKNQPLHYLVHLKASGLSLDSQYKLVVDTDKNGKISGGDTINFNFSLTNKGNQASRYVTVTTGIPKNSLVFLHNYLGTTGIAGN